MKSTWSLTISDVLKRPLFQHAEVLAGSRGLMGSIRWVHILESASNAHFLNGGELILSTGVGFGEDADKRLTYLNELIRRKAVGLCIELGPYIPQIPADMLELAEHHEFPLIAFHQPVRFVDITLDLHENIVSLQTAALRKLEAYSRDLQQLTLQIKGIPKLLSHFQAHVQTQVFYLPVEEPPIFSPEMPQTVQTEMMSLLQSSLLTEKTWNEQHGVLEITDKKRILYKPIQVMGHVLAYLGLVLYEREPEEFLLLTLDYTATAMAQILMRQMFAEERSLDSQNRLFDDLLADRFKHEEQIRSLLGIRQTPRTNPYHAAIMEISEGNKRSDGVAESPFHDMTGVFRSILLRYGFRSLIRIKGNRLYMLLIERQSLEEWLGPLKRAMGELERLVRQNLDSEDRVTLGISRRSERYADAYRHFQEAEQVLSVRTDSFSPFFDDLGVYRLLMHVEGLPVLRSFVSDYLGPLIEHDREFNSQLLQTLRVLLDHNGSKQEAAEQLFIHRQTLYHRLEKIRALIGDTYMAPHHRICLEIALRAYDWVKLKD